MEELQFFMNGRKKTDLLDLYDMLCPGDKLPKSWTKQRIADCVLEAYKILPNILIYCFSIDEIDWIMSFKGKSPKDMAAAFVEQFRAPLSESSYVSRLLANSLVYLGLIDEEQYDLTPAAAFLLSLIPAMEDSRPGLETAEIIGNCVHGMLIAYGIIEYDELCRMIAGLLKFDDPKAADFAIWKRLMLRSISYIVCDENGDRKWLCLDDLEEPDMWIEWLENHPKHEYRPFTVEELVSFAENDYPGSPEGIDRLLDLYKLHTDDEFAALFRTKQTIMDIENDPNCETGPLDKLYIEPDSPGEAKMLVELLTSINNTLPMWVLFGRTPNEMYTQHTPIVKPQKIGRNDPCPCGSGKKYKNCCGRNVS